MADGRGRRRGIGPPGPVILCIRGWDEASQWVMLAGGRGRESRIKGTPRGVSGQVEVGQRVRASSCVRLAEGRGLEPLGPVIMEIKGLDQSPKRGREDSVPGDPEVENPGNPKGFNRTG